MFKKLKENQGLTLVEVIVTIAILSIIITPIFSMFITTAKANRLSEEKMQATLIAQDVMENIKGITDLGLIQDEYDIDDYKVEVSKEETEYKFSYIGTGSEASSNDYDVRVKIELNGQINVYQNHPQDEDLNNDLIVLLNGTDPTINIIYDGSIHLNNSGDDADISISGTPEVMFEMYGNKYITIYAKNEVVGETLVLYLMKSPHIDSNYSFYNLGGNIIVHDNIYITETEDTSNATRIYKITVTVKNKVGDVIEEITGYKTFLQ